MNKRQRGTALVELAFVLPLLLLVSVLTVEFGRAVYEYNTVTKSVRDAVRYLSMHTPGTHMSEARNLVVFGKIRLVGGETPLAPGLSLDPNRVPDPIWRIEGTAPVINTVTVTVRGYPFASLFTTVFGFNFEPIIFSDISATMRSQL
ncbi:MAG TPA: TadE/TadG family type IV pilus assembly protein [Noviherbaspirillum sp.]|uniref:TadE/TadG family type IV pilus assembly protein n=1 Tax=Noviherbaspirillum sp. TaxID=1926288 RepID=UPI002D51621E|nr:TadE/TadG family type IV pilus assembly protein [Noviherbaspirillum sp.]HYD95486.1 TadE/TadG family type IV pilus assembly protein [Noviherbaspirillum sp.]